MMICRRYGRYPVDGSVRLTVLYHLASRGIEYDLLPWCQQQQMPVMAYSPLALAGRLRGDLLSNSVVNDIARVHNVSAAQILLAWVIRQSGVIAIPKAASVAHVEQNAAALQITLSVDELKQLDKAYPAPKVKQRWIWPDLPNDDAHAAYQANGCVFCMPDKALAASGMLH